VEVPKSFLSTLKAGFFSSARARLETALLAGRPHRGMGSRQRLWMSITGNSSGEPSHEFGLWRREVSWEGGWSHESPRRRFKSGPRLFWQGHPLGKLRLKDDDLTGLRDLTA